MVNKVYSNRISEYAHENGGRVLLLFLLFMIALYQLATTGLPFFSIICLIPIIVIFIHFTFKWRMFVFWILIIVNYFLQMKDIPLPVPTSLPNELLQILLLIIAIIDTRQSPNFERSLNIMLLGILSWCTYCTIEILNNTCGLGLNIKAWYTGARMMAFQMLYIFFVFTIYISSPERLLKYLKLWGLLALFSAFWTWKQQNMGLTVSEHSFMYGRGLSTHVLQGGTLIRYFSTFSDAANYGCNAAATAIAFIVIGITTTIKKDKLFFVIISVLVIWQMFASGTRSATFCLIAGFMVFLVLSRSIRIIIPSAIIGGILLFILIFTNIGNGNQQIRRMRSGFNKDDASSNVRDINQATMKKYIKDAPWGIGIGMGMDNVPANNKYRLLATIPPDSEYVNIWLRTGPIGITIFIITMLMMLGGACWIVLFKLKNKSLIGIGAGLCSAFVAIQLGGYANQVLMQFPNGLIFYGGLSIVYILPYLEPEWIEYENKRLTIQEEKKRVKLEEKLAKRV